MRHIPNVLSAIRLILVGVFIFLFARAKYLACLIVFLTAFFTDLLDGYLARRNNWISDLGKVLDPLADKLMVIAALSCFYSAGWLPLWILLAVLIKEGIMIIGGLLLSVGRWLCTPIGTASLPRASSMQALRLRCLKTSGPG